MPALEPAASVMVKVYSPGTRPPMVNTPLSPALSSSFLLSGRTVMSSSVGRSLSPSTGFSASVKVNVSSPS